MTFSEPCYCHVGEGLAGQPLQKAGQFNAHSAAVGPKGSDEKVIQISRLTCSCRNPAAAGQPGDSTLLFTSFFWIFLIKILLAISPMFFICFSIFFLQLSMDVRFSEKLVFFRKNHRCRRCRRQMAKF